MSKKNTKIEVKGIEVTFVQTQQEDFICITDIAKFKNPDAPRDIIKNWMRSKNTIALLGLWEKLNNPDFKQVEFNLFKNEAGFNHFVLSPQKWISSTNASGLQCRVKADKTQSNSISQMKILLNDNGIKRLDNE